MCVFLRFENDTDEVLCRAEQLLPEMIISTMKGTKWEMKSSALLCVKANLSVLRSDWLKLCREVLGNCAHLWHPDTLFKYEGAQPNLCD